MTKRELEAKVLALEARIAQLEAVREPQPFKMPHWVPAPSSPAHPLRFGPDHYGYPPGTILCNSTAAGATK